MSLIPSFISNFFTANRVATIVTDLTALAAFIAALVGTFPTAWQNTALAIVAVVTKLANGLKFLDGSQKWDAIQATPIPSDSTESEDTPYKLAPAPETPKQTGVVPAAGPGA